MSRNCMFLILMVLLVAACQPEPAADVPPTAIPFPTVTPGRLLHGVLPTVVALPLDGNTQLANPATAVALANLPTPTPNYAACPPFANPEIPALAANGSDITAAITRFVSAGGSAEALTAVLRDDWNVLDETGVVRQDVDFIGAGAPQLLLTYNAPDSGGTLLILGCVNGQYAPLYQSVTGTMPQLITAGDMNFDGKPELLYSAQQCQTDNPDDCAYRTHLLGWQAESGRFVSLLNSAITSTELPTTDDMDNDRVFEVVVRTTSAGTRATGPLRTGVNIYDWNGSYYALSIVQLDPPRFVIQVIQEADRAFNRSEIDQAIALFDMALKGEGLRYWFDDEPPLLKTYAMYRLLVLYAYTEQEEKALGMLQLSLEQFPNPDGPVYAAMINAFWNAYQTTNNLHSACEQVQAIITARPEAVEALNRYGSHSPTYTAADLCSF